MPHHSIKHRHSWVCPRGRGENLMFSFDQSTKERTKVPPPCGKRELSTEKNQLHLNLVGNNNKLNNSKNLRQLNSSTKIAKLIWVISTLKQFIAKLAGNTIYHSYKERFFFSQACNQSVVLRNIDNCLSNARRLSKTPAFVKNTAFILLRIHLQAFCG